MLNRWSRLLPIGIFLCLSFYGLITYSTIVYDVTTSGSLNLGLQAAEPMRLLSNWSKGEQSERSESAEPAEVGALTARPPPPGAYGRLPPGAVTLVRAAT